MQEQRISADVVTDGFAWGVEFTPGNDLAAEQLVAVAQTLGGDVLRGLAGLVEAGAPSPSVVADTLGSETMRVVRGVLAVYVPGDTRCGHVDPDDGVAPLALSTREGSPVAAEPRDCLDCGDYREPGEVVCRACLDRYDAQRAADRAADRAEYRAVVA